MLIAVWQLEKRQAYLAGKLLKVLADKSISAGRIDCISKKPRERGSEHLYGCRASKYIARREGIGGIYIERAEILPLLMVHYGIQQALSKGLGGRSDSSILQQSGGLQKVDAGGSLVNLCGAAGGVLLEPHQGYHNHTRGR